MAWMPGPLQCQAVTKMYSSCASDHSVSRCRIPHNQYQSAQMRMSCLSSTLHHSLMLDATANAIVSQVSVIANSLISYLNCIRHCSRVQSGRR